jgi:hypothetical protein
MQHCNTAFLADSAVLLVQTRLNLWDQSVPDRRSTFWSTESQARFKTKVGVLFARLTDAGCTAEYAVTVIVVLPLNQDSPDDTRLA